MAGTRKGGLNGMTVQESNNAALGQGGSIFIDDGDAYTPPAGQVFISITMLTAVTFTADATGLAAQDPTKCIGTNGTEKLTGPPGQVIDASNVFPPGLTIHGRWTSIDLNGGSVIAYLG
tara:strand:+ start:1395 stop:1751 length:357 start_codon:yes stop_codon:yes gene_type:complete